MAKLTNLVASIFMFRPPDDAGIHAEQRRFNWRIFVAVIIVGVVTFGDVVLSYGFVPGLFRGFAVASDVQSVISEQKKSRLTALQAIILDTNEKRCKADGQARALYMRILTDVREEFRESSGHPIDLPSCDELGIDQPRG